MNVNIDIETTEAFYKQLFNSSKYVMLFIAIASVMQLYAHTLFSNKIMSTTIIVLTVIKVVVVVRFTFYQLTKIISQTHLLSHVLVLFGFLIVLIIISFSIDFSALYLVDSQHFKIENSSNLGGLSLFFEMCYYSTITFSSVGYGDIVPISMASKAIVLLEIALRFFVLVFGIANINQIKINQNNK